MTMEKIDLINLVNTKAQIAHEAIEAERRKQLWAIEHVETLLKRQDAAYSVDGWEPIIESMVRLPTFP